MAMTGIMQREANDRHEDDALFSAAIMGLGMSDLA